MEFFIGVHLRKSAAKIFAFLFLIRVYSR